MIDSISASDIANEVSMMRSVFKGTVLIVEGVTDSRLYSKFAEREAVKVLIAHSKDNVRRSVTECLTRRGDDRVVGIIDKDIDGLIGRKKSPPLFDTDRNDVESMMMCSKAFDDVMSEYADGEKLKSFEERYGKLSDAIARAACPICTLMYISYKRGMNMSFKDLDHSRFVNPHTLEIDIPRMVAEVYSQSMAQMYPKQTIVDQIRSMVRNMDDPWDAVRGHDAVSILALALRNGLGSYNAKYIRDGELSGALRLAYGLAYFKRTDLYASSGNWCGSRGMDLWVTRRSGNPS